MSPISPLPFVYILGLIWICCCCCRFESMHDVSPVNDITSPYSSYSSYTLGPCYKGNNERHDKRNHIILTPIHFLTSHRYLSSQKYSGFVSATIDIGHVRDPLQSRCRPPGPANEHQATSDGRIHERMRRELSQQFVGHFVYNKQTFESQ